MIRRLLTILGIAAALLGIGATSAFACGGLIAPGHGEVLRRATTLAAWHGGYEHYVTGFTFAGNAEKFGYIIPLPGVPAKIEKGGDWTLERLQREVNPVTELAAFARGFAATSSKSVEVLKEVRVDALDIKVVRGGGRDVATWARENGFDMTKDTDTVLGTYSSARAIFAVAKFDSLGARKRGLVEGQGTTIHFTIPTKGPWIPLRILALGKAPTEAVDADLFVLTDGVPTFAPAPRDLDGMTITHLQPASNQLLSDLRSDRGMSWVPGTMWLTAIKLSAPASTVRYDLAVDGARPVALPRFFPSGSAGWPLWMAMIAAAYALVAVLRRTRPAHAA
ncbi:MAG: DUF2330 domain-containing protein [Actinomycetota bacterium]|nr:DUF2330 domain-containing protein [Actinomycetota bacterium]